MIDAHSNNEHVRMGCLAAEQTNKMIRALSSCLFSTEFHNGILLRNIKNREKFITYRKKSFNSLVFFSFAFRYFFYWTFGRVSSNGTKYPFGDLNQRGLFDLVLLSFAHVGRVEQTSNRNLWNVGYWNKICKSHKRPNKTIPRKKAWVTGAGSRKKWKNYEIKQI